MPSHPLKFEEDLMSDLDRIIRLKAVLARTGLSRSTIYRKIREGSFPAQVAISVHGAGWHESAVNRWIANPAGWRPPIQGACGKGA
jgi:prophage regulatory protein